MPDLLKSLQGYDLGHLRIVAELWGIELDAPDARLGVQRLTACLLDRQRLAEVVNDLPIEARQALYELLHYPEYRLNWALFVRRFGTVREMGPGRRDRERPYLSPVSTAEVLWYRALIGRAFFDTPNGPEEFAYIPQDLATLLPESPAPAQPALGRPATPAERARIFPASDRILDHACTLLAALRLGFSTGQLQDLERQWGTFSAGGELPGGAPPLTVQTLQALLAAAGLLDAQGIPLPEPTRQFLEASRSQALAQLAGAWLRSDSFNELRLLPGLIAEGEWKNDPLRARRAVLDFLTSVPGAESPSKRLFWGLDSFVYAIRQRFPDFQRPAGDYDSWYLRDASTGEYLRGFEHWDRVDGALVRYIIAGPLHWLGILELAGNEAFENASSASRLTAFCYSEWAPALLRAQPPAGLPEETAAMQVRSDARLIVPRLAPRAVRYQIARFCEWEAEKPDTYSYRITPRSLARARSQGLRANHLLALLQRHARTVAPSLVRALERWERVGVEARLAQVVILRLSTPELLQAVRSSKAGRFLGEPLGPTAIIVKPGAQDRVIAALAELGYLAEVETL